MVFTMNKKLLVSFVGACLLSLFLVPLVSATPEYSTRGKPPTNGYVTITSPSNGATVSGTVSIVVDSNDTPKIYIDGSQVVRGFTYTWDTTAYSDGSHTITAEIRGASETISVTVDNGGSGGGEEPPTGGDGVVNKYALCIGISDYEGTDSDLTYCDDDAYDWINYLQSEGYQIISLLNNQATHANILAALQQLADLEDADDMVAVTYSGHGYYSREYRESCWVSHDLYGVWETEIDPISDTFDSTAIFWFNDCCNIGTFSDLANNGWVVGMGSTTRTYTYDGDSTMNNGIYTYYAMEAISLGYYTAEDICAYAAQQFNAATPGQASTIDNYTGDLDL